MAITVTALHVTPVKALRIRAVDAVELGPTGARGDRAFYVIDDAGAMVNGKRLGALQTVSAELDPAGEQLTLGFADGETVTAPVRLGGQLGTTFFGAERRARLLDGPWAAVLSRQLGRELRLVADGSAVDRGTVGAVSLVSRGSLERLARAEVPARPSDPAHPAPVDNRRFRMLIEIDGVEPHTEDGWLGRELQVGSARLRMHGNVGRCVTTTRGPESGEVDLPTLKMLATYRSELESTEPLPFGVHGEVLAAGTVRVGDPVRIDPMSDRVSVTIDGHVATVTLTRPDKHNALDVAMFEAILGAAERLRGEPGVRAVVLHGAGPSFCSGLDVGAIMAAGGGVAGLSDRIRGEVPNWFQRASHDWLTLPMPVIAALHGAVLGGGLQIALGADIRICAPDARLSVMEVKWGLIPDMGITRTLPRLVAIDVAKELTYTGRTVSGEEARALGLVTRVSGDPLTAARELAVQIAARSPDAVRRAKRLYETGWTGEPAQTLALEAELQLELVGSPNQLAAVTAGFSGEPAAFADPPGLS